MAAHSHTCKVMCMPNNRSVVTVFHYLKPQYYMHCVRRLPPAGRVLVPQQLKAHHTTGEYDHITHTYFFINSSYIHYGRLITKEFPIILL